MKSGLPVGILVILLGALLGCASNQQALLFHSSIDPSAEVYLDGEKIGQAPGRIRIPAIRLQNGGLLELRVEGKEPQTLLLPPSEANGWIWIDLVGSPDPEAPFQLSSGFIYQPANGNPDAARFTEK